MLASNPPSMVPSLVGHRSQGCEWIAACGLIPLPGQTPAENCGLNLRSGWLPENLRFSLPLLFPSGISSSEIPDVESVSVAHDTDSIGLLSYNITLHFKFFTHRYSVARLGPKLEPQSRSARSVSSRQQCSGRIALLLVLLLLVARRVPAWVSITSYGFCFSFVKKFNLHNEMGCFTLLSI